MGMHMQCMANIATNIGADINCSLPSWHDEMLEELNLTKI